MTTHLYRQALMEYSRAVEIEALKFAVDWLRNAQQSNFINGLSPLHPDAGHAFLQQMLRLALELHNPRQVLAIVEAARIGWDACDTAIRDFLLERSARGEAVPPLLAEYHAGIVAGHTRPNKPRGQKKAAKVMADITIVTLVMAIVERFGLRPTRNPVRHQEMPCGCSIASQALTAVGMHRGGEASITQIWKRYAPAVIPGWRALTVVN